MLIRYPPMNRPSLAVIIGDLLVNSKWAGALFRGNALAAIVGFLALLVAQRTHSTTLSSVGVLLVSPFLLIYGGALVIVAATVLGFWLFIVFHGLFGPNRRDGDGR
jgi:hypothetical protein